MSVLDLAWSNDYVLGIDVIDEQHRRLFAYFEEIDDAISEGSAAKVTAVVHGLVEYAISHNSYEEELMLEADYPELEEHRRVHESFKARANKYVRRLENNTDPFKVAEQVRIYLGLWLISHVKQDDRDYVPYVKKIIKNKRRLSIPLARFFKGK